MLVRRPSAAATIRHGFASLGVLGAVGAFWEWSDHGPAAGLEPGFIVAMCAVVIGCLSWTILTVVPMAVAAYGTGVRDGRRCADCPIWGKQEPQQSRHLSAVRR